jgi:hypothetical protein
VFEGNLTREYSKTRYLEYIKDDIIISDDYSGKLISGPVGTSALSL